MRISPDFLYDIGQDVNIIPIKLPGRITQRNDWGNGKHEYQVVFWSVSERKVEWLMPHEIEPAK